MCGICGCSDPATIGAHSHGAHDHAHSHTHQHAHERSVIFMEQDLLSKNDRLARGNRKWFESQRITALNVMSSPGAGKTTLLERTIARLQDLRLFVIEGDQATEHDADRIRKAGCRAIQINTGAGCHLDAHMVGHATKQLEPGPGSLLFIENVGNLVCPALFDLGEAARVVVLSVTEGDDKPLKYPHMFKASSLMVVNKVDLLPYVDFNVQRTVEFARRINPSIEVLEVSATRGDGMESWCAWLRARLPGESS